MRFVVLNNTERERLEYLQKYSSNSVERNPHFKFFTLCLPNHKEFPDKQNNLTSW